ncbi:MAG: hypothetical protein DI539_16775 [Flavobacterium psychrophilum]|nr:MAG: hypothetical protein DI539_16775 [Flavobacterium psychrophilum]
MKKYLIKTALLATLGFGILTSCDEDTVTYSGPNFVSFDRVSETGVKAFENGGVFEIAVNLAFPKSEDVIISFDVTSEVAVEGDDFVVVNPNKQVVIPAGELSGTISVNIIDNDVLDDSKKLQITLLDVVQGSSVNLGLADEGSYDKTLLVVNDDCTTNYFTWVGDLKYTSVGGTAPETGLVVGNTNANGDCNTLRVEGDFAYGPAQQYPTEFKFTPGANASQGTVTAVEQIWCQQCYTDDDKTYDVLFTGSGTYNSNTKKLIISGACSLSLGSFPSRTITFEPTQN